MVWRSIGEKVIRDRKGEREFIKDLDKRETVILLSKRRW
jgi:hypothetical protein